MADVDEGDHPRKKRLAPGEPVHPDPNNLPAEVKLAADDASEPVHPDPKRRPPLAAAERDEA